MTRPEKIRTAFGTRLFQARTASGLSQQALANMVGMSQSTLTEAETKQEGSRYTVALARALKVRPEWLADGIGPMRSEEQETPAPLPDHGIAINQSKVRQIWVVGRGAGGLMPERIWTDGGYPTGITDQHADLASADPQAFLAEVIGQSMFPKYESRNFALVEPNAPIDLEDVVFVRLKSGETLIKRLLSRRNGLITLGSYNDPAILEFDANDISWMYYCAHEVPRKRIKSRF